MSKYEVQEWCLCGGWTNTWSDEHGETVFDSQEQAEAELKAYLDDIDEDFKAGFLVDVPARDSYRVMEVV